MPSPSTPPRPEKLTEGSWNTLTSYSSGLNAAGTNLSTISGAGSFQLQSGPGRVDYIYLNPSQSFGGAHNLNSGGPILLYDAAPGATSGGPFVASGEKLIAWTYPPQIFATQSGFPQPTSLPNPVPFATVFNSGLFVRLQSGQPGFTVGWSPEPSPLNLA